uniref:Uncharacterized protein n=1 Tax=Heterorhabditis bacteriophora TaxID=37862 RepID=A0A1I7XVV9_HETBA
MEKAAHLIQQLSRAPSKYF